MKIIWSLFQNFINEGFWGFGDGAKLVEIPVKWTDDDAGRIRLGKAAGDYARAWGRLVWKS